MIKELIPIDNISVFDLISSILSLKRRISHQINEITHNLASVCFITKYHVLFERYSDRADQKEFKDVKKSEL